MDSIEAAKLLSSSDPGERLRAARHFQYSAARGDRALLFKALHSEKIHWIRNSLREAISRTEAPSVDKLNTKLDESRDEITKDAYSKAIESVSGILLHEVSSVVGTVDIHCSLEIKNYSLSKAKESIDRLKSLLEAIRRLKKAVAIPEPTEFDLSNLVAMIAREEAGSNSGEMIRFAGPRPFMTTTDREVLSIAVANGLRNALEASKSNEDRQEPEVIVNWGRSRGEVFLVILDSGTGLPENTAMMAEIGQTTKIGHLGFGLATTLQAMQSLKGSMLLVNGNPLGAVFELRWRDLENTDN